MTAFDMLTKLIDSYTKFIVVFILLMTLCQSKSFSNESLEIEIDNPRFSEKGLDNRLYEIKASRGVQKEDNLELFNVEGKLRTDSGTWIYLNAKKGNFNQLEDFIELSGEINFYSDESDKFQSDYALFLINDDLIEFNKNIKHIKDSSIITADESKMKNNFNHIIYQGNVSTLYVID